MSYQNLEGFQQKAAILSTLQPLECDVVGFQHVDSTFENPADHVFCTPALHCFVLNPGPCVAACSLYIGRPEIEPDKCM